MNESIDKVKTEGMAGWLKGPVTERSDPWGTGSE